MIDGPPAHDLFDPRVEVRIRAPDEIVDGDAIEVRDGAVGQREAPGRVLDVDEARVGVEHEAEEVALVRQRLFGAPPFAAVAGLDELALERRRQPRQVLLRHEVVRPGLENRDCRRFVDGSRYDDERQVETAGLHQRQGVGTGEIGQRMIADDGVDAGRERHGVTGAIAHACCARRIARLAQGAEEDAGVLVGVFDEQESDGRAHSGLQPCRCNGPLDGSARDGVVKPEAGVPDRQRTLGRCPVAEFRASENWRETRLPAAAAVSTGASWNRGGAVL